MTKLKKIFKKPPELTIRTAVSLASVFWTRNIHNHHQVDMNSGWSPLVKKAKKRVLFSSIKLTSATTKGLFFLLLLWLLTACQSSYIREQSDNSREERSETQLTLENAILEQSNTKGNIIWKVKSNKTTYSPDRQTAKLEEVTANLLENGKIILQLSSRKGEIKQNGTIILLQEQILVTDPRNQAVVRSELAEWQPAAQILKISRGIEGSNDNLKVTADRGIYSIERQSLELAGNIIATTVNPSLQLKTDQLIWSIPQQKVIGNRPLEVVSYQNNRISDRVVAEQGNVDLQQNVISLQQNVEMRSQNPPIQIATNSLDWNYETRIVTSDSPIQIIDLDNQLNIVANQGTIDLDQQIANLDNGIKGTNNRNQSHLYARQLVWDIPTEKVEATGNVIYRQVDPPLNLRGDKAIGTLNNNNVVITSKNRQNQVITEINP
ncbi:MAG: LPS export ABC transporter periplasmic protein LptC [Xenococcaceae cyanobacterium]